MTDDALLGGGASDVTGGDAEPVAEVAEPVAEVKPPKKKGGRPAGSKNKPKPPPSDPNQVAILGGSSVVGRTPKGKTPANTPSGSAV
jgi:hypothetical protein